MERRFYPDAGLQVGGVVDARCRREGVSICEAPVSRFSNADVPSIAVEESDDARQRLRRSLEIPVGLADIDAAGCDPAQASGVQQSRTPPLFQENPDSWRLAAPHRIRIDESCSTNNLEYQEIFGQRGSIQRFKEQFISSRFHPRTALQLHRSDHPPVDLESPAQQPTDVCETMFSRISHAA